MRINTTITNPERILIFSHDNKIGDAVLLNSLIKPLKQQWVSCLIDVAAGKNNAAIWQANPDINKVFIIPSRSVLTRFWCGLKLSRSNYSIAIVTSGEHQGKSFSIMRWAARIKRILWISTTPVGRKNDILIIRNWDDGHFLDRCQAVLDTILSAPVKVKPQLSLPQDSINFANEYWRNTHSSDYTKILLNSGASGDDRRLSPPKVLLICDSIFAIAPKVLLHIISQNTKHASDLKKELNSSKHSNQIFITPPKKNILDVAALIRDCDVLISPDTFAIHIASAFNTPVVAIFIAPAAIISWSPKSEINRLLIANKKVDNIDPNQVARATRDIINTLNFHIDKSQSI
ncbi:glycosyltransferase family 9 protein [Methyloradius palustris]|uniref:glycosyltransferase family 9 protein n=1 Tax=Methyloradius palustris TaxID=2778876 RepID=UPI001C8B1C97|nr:glycosyltransferase family 9 protein [Methyloradius palustris]